MSGAPDFSSLLHDALRPGMTVALGDGVGAVATLDDGSSICTAISEVARRLGGIRMVLGWLPAKPPGLQADAFAEVVTLMPGWGVRDLLREPSARFVPTSLAGIAGLLGGPLRPDVLITRLTRRNRGLHFGTEVSWQRELVDAGVPVLAVVDDAMPCADAGAPLDDSGVRVLACCSTGPARLPGKEPEPVHETLADEVLKLIPAGARVQYGPGQLGTALLRQTAAPLRIDTGLLTDAVVDLDRRGLLAAIPSATYLLGGDVLYDWADGRPVLRGVGHTHDVTRLSRGEPFVAVNTAIEIDPLGQVNVEGVGENVVGGIGGHPDFCSAAHSSPLGLSIIAVPSRYDGRPTLVDRLSRPVSTPAHNVDIIATESGHVDLRAADWHRRRELIGQLFGI